MVDAKTTQQDRRTWRFTVNGVTLELARKTLALVRLSCGRQVWLDNGHAGAPIWQLHVADAYGQRIDLDGAKTAKVRARMDGATLHLAWTGVRDAASGAGPFDVRVNISPSDAGPGLTSWRLRVANRSSAWTLWHFNFPRLSGLMPGKNPDADRVFWPEMWGMQTTGWNAMSVVSGPCGGYGKHSAQFMGFSRGGQSLYLGAHDPEQWPKEMHFDPGRPESKPRRAQLHFLAHPMGMTQAGNNYEQPYDIVVGEVAGDWFDVSRVYAAWVREQAWVNRPPARADRGPREAREVLVWEQATINTFPSDRIVTVNDKPVAQWAAEMKALRRRLGVRLAVHMYTWHQTPFDTNYPDYFPVKRGFKKLVAELKAAGIMVMPYINGRLWDHSAPSYDARAERAAVKCCAQRVDPPLRFAWPESYGNGQLLVTMCLHTGFWRNRVVGLCRRIVKELGCGGVYLDQLGCSGSRTCVDPAHGHPLGGGGYWLAGYRKLMTAIRAEIGPEPMLTTENNWEACVADFDALLDVGWNHETNIPIFPAVYWGHGAIYGGGVFNDTYQEGGAVFAQRMGMRCVWGGELGWGHFENLLKPENRALLAYFSALCRLRTESGRFFCRGEFLRPPEVRLAASNRVCTSPLKGPVLAGMWSDPDALRAAVFLVNVTRQPQRVRVRITDPRWRRAQNASGGRLIPSKNGPWFELRLAALATAAVPVKNA